MLVRNLILSNPFSHLDTQREIRQKVRSTLGLVFREESDIGPGPSDKLNDRIQRLIQELGHGSPGIRDDAFRDLIEIGTKAVPALVESLKDEDDYANKALVLIRIATKSKETVPALIQALDSSDKLTRARATFILGHISPKITQS